jgi:hypothetical protein
MERKLASIQKITNLSPILNRDRILLAEINHGWHVIVGKDDFHTGDLCVYIEIDSVLPERSEFEQARKRANRIRTMKMAGVYSEGIAYPLSILPEGDWKEGDDVTQLLGITKYDEYAGDDMPCRQVVKKNKYTKWQLFWYKIFGFPKKKDDSFPSLVSKTDETRIQNVPDALKYKEPVVVTQKVDGASCTAVIEHTGFFFPKEKFTLASRNRSLSEKDNSHYWRIAEEYDLQERMSLMLEEWGSPWLAIQGEVAGPAIQGNPDKLKELDFFVFNIIDPSGRWPTEKMAEWCYRYGLSYVPIIDTNYILPDTVEEMLKYATGPSLLNPNELREGVVIRSKDGQKSFKAVSPEYLVKHGK